MKVSRWLFLVRTDEGVALAWSSLTGALAKVDDEFLGVIEALKSGGNVDTASKLIGEMLRCGFVVGDDVDELAAYGELADRTKQSVDALKLVIAPTLDCNFACPYCFETRKDVSMSREVQGEIVRYVRKTLESQTVKAFSVVWYGGEPLLKKDVIAGLSEAFMNICKANGVTYNASIITNGYLVDEENAKLLKDCGVTFAQVTIDGGPEVHNKRRMLRVSPDEGTYSRVVEGVNVLTDAGISVSVRMNVDRNNAGAVGDGIAMLAGVIRDKSKVSFSCGHVVHYGEESSACLSKEEYSSVILECLKHCEAHGLDFSAKTLYPKFRPSYCSAVMSGSFVIDPEGLVYKCWNDIGIREYSIGTVNVLIDGGLAEEFACSVWGRYSQMNYEACRECKLLPVCAGGCPHEAVHYGKRPACEPCKYILDELLMLQVKGGVRDGNNS